MSIVMHCQLCMSILWKVIESGSILELHCHTKTKMKADDRLIFRLPTSRKMEFINKVEKEGRKTSEVLNELVERYLSEPDQRIGVEELSSRLKKIEEIVMGESAA
ncbi:hypothetical protein IQ247_09425 [Plectonema cf. radiosum LEGE 06105]|uniref:Uncharacterized protein n=1 Tax=Plectonema cf. radiosum LEGE 06105 TaxID=945769 RepID=A0A8J7JSS7_9CYAN|nr:hypothetical protein [Plectonema radiosum]MBE9212909.1 hypothetical protein [Plectonema cf. radiosum LEGE 06105]